MTIILTENQRKIVEWLVSQSNLGLLPDEFIVRWELKNYIPDIGTVKEIKGKQPKITFAALLAIEKAGLILTTYQKMSTSKKSGIINREKR